MNAILQQLRNLGTARLAAVGGGLLLLIGLGIFAMTGTSGPEMALLYSDLKAADAAQVTQRLDQTGVKYELRGEGTQIFVPADIVAKTRITMAGEGLPKGGTVGYEIFDQSQGLATSSFVQNVNQIRALEGELERTLTAIENVKSARVHLVLPQRELFSREKRPPSASVMLRMNGPQRLERPQILAIQHLIASSVPELKPERISIVDERGTLLARGMAADGSNGAAMLAAAEEFRIGYERQIGQRIELLLERSLGFGKARAEVSVQIDNDRVVENQEIYNPDQQVIRSNQIVNDTSEQIESDGNPSVTIANNLPQGSASGSGALTSQSRTARNEETTNYEISRVVRNSTREPGGIKRVSAAVLVDGTYTYTADGVKQYNPRSQRELEQIEALVRSAMGYEGQRGDQVEVVNMQFATLEDELPPTPKLLGLDRQEFIKIAEIVVLGAVGLLVLLLVVRPLLTRLFDAVPSAASGAAGAALLGGPGGAAALTGPGGALAMAPSVEISDSIEEMIDLNRIEGRVKASSLRKIGEIVEKHPEDVVAIIRTWLYQES